jgi:hypothetical protein
VTSTQAWAAAVRRVLRGRAGIDVVAMTPTRSGESGATFWITDRSGAVMLLKVISGPLAHMVLRQVDWSLRHHPGAAMTRRHLGLARLVMSDITDGGPLS